MRHGYTVIGDCRCCCCMYLHSGCCSIIPMRHRALRSLPRFVYDLDIPLVNGRVPFHKTAFELVKRTSQADIPDGQLKVSPGGQRHSIQYVR